MAKLPPMNIGVMSGKSSKFRLPYSRTPNFQLPEFVPKDKRMGELTIGIRYVETLMKYGIRINGVMLNDDDSEGKADVLLYREDKVQGIQITRLTFTEYERRRAHHTKKVLSFAEALRSKVQVDFPIIVQIYPTERDTVPLAQLKKNRQATLEKILISFIAASIQSNLDLLRKAEDNINLWQLPSELRSYFHGLTLLGIPQGFFANVPGADNFFIDYKFYDSTYDDKDIEKEVARIYNAKNGTLADVLIVWANGHELLMEDKIVAAFQRAFEITTFKEVYFLVSHFEGRLHSIKGSPY